MYGVKLPERVKVGGGSDAGFIHILVKKGKWLDGNQSVKETDRASEVLEENVTFVVGREVDMLSEIERKKLRGESVCRIIKMHVKVAGDDEFMRCGCSKGEKRTEVIEKDTKWFRMSG